MVMTNSSTTNVCTNPITVSLLMKTRNILIPLYIPVFSCSAYLKVLQYGLKAVISCYQLGQLNGQSHLQGVKSESRTCHEAQSSQNDFAANEEEHHK